MNKNQKRIGIVVIISIIALGCYLYLTSFLRLTDLDQTEIKQIDVENLATAKVANISSIEEVESFLEAMEFNRWIYKWIWHTKLAPNRFVSIDNVVIGFFSNNDKYVQVFFKDKRGVYYYKIPNSAYEKTWKQFESLNNRICF